MPPALPINQMRAIFGNQWLISAYLPHTTGPGQGGFCEVVTFTGFAFTTPPNVLLTSASVHFIASPIWIATTAIGICVDKKSEPASSQSLNIYLHIHGTVPSSISDDVEFNLHVKSVNNFSELQMAAPK